MMADYAATFGGFPAPDAPWRLFLAAVARTPRYEARRQLTLFDAVSGAISGTFSETGATLGRVARDRLVRRAYPVRRREPVFHPNMFAPDYAEPADA